jgi:hypothetical protein
MGEIIIVLNISIDSNLILHCSEKMDGLATKFERLVYKNRKLSQAVITA